MLCNKIAPFNNTHTHASTHTFIHAHAHTSTHIYASTHTRTPHTRTHAYTRTVAPTRTHVPTHTHARTYTDPRTYAHVHTHSDTGTDIQRQRESYSLVIVKYSFSDVYVVCFIVCLFGVVRVSTSGKTVQGTYRLPLIFLLLLSLDI